LQQCDLKEMVQVEDYDTLREMGTDTLLRRLSSDVEQGIATVERVTNMYLDADSAEAPSVMVMSLAERRRIYGENEAPAWNIRRSVAEAWKPVVSIDCLPSPRVEDVNADNVQALMAWISIFLVVLGLVADFVLRSPDERTTDWAVSLVVLAIIAVMVKTPPLCCWRIILKHSQLLFQVLISRRMAYQIHILRKEIEGPKLKVVRDGTMQNIYKQV